MATVSRYQTASGATLWRCRFRTPDGRQTDKRGFKIKRDAEAFAEDVGHAKRHNAYVAPSDGRRTIGELGTAWLARQAGHMKPSSIHAYRSAWSTNVEPHWGRVPIAKICHSDICAWLAKLGTVRGAESVRRAHKVLSAILADAVRDRMLAANPAAGVKLPARPPSRQVFLTRDQLDHLADEAGPYRSLVLLLGCAGPRWGEAAALRVSDVDWLHRRVHLHENAVTINGHVVVGTLKSGKSRTVALPEFVIGALSVAAAGKSRDALLWSRADGSHLRSPTTRSWLSAAVRRCQAADESFPRVTAHDLRHTAASLAISAGASVKAVSRMLGHTNAAMTLDTYVTLFESDLDTAAENMGKMWAQARQPH
jgi:integrase